MTVELSAVPDGVLLPVKVIPRARVSGAQGVFDGALKLRLASPPVDGKANAECVALVAALFGLKKSAVEIVRGESSRNKTLLLRGLTLDTARARLQGIVAG